MKGDEREEERGRKKAKRKIIDTKSDELRAEWEELATQGVRYYSLGTKENKIENKIELLKRKHQELAI